MNKKKASKSNDLQRLLNLVGPKAMRSLKHRNGVLKIWRNSSPHNWWVESAKGKMYWHSSSEDWIRPNLSNFELVDEEGKIVPYFGKDSGKPVLSIYKLKEREIK